MRAKLKTRIRLQKDLFNRIRTRFLGDRYAQKIGQYDGCLCETRYIFMGNEEPDSVYSATIALPDGELVQLAYLFFDFVDDIYWCEECGTYMTEDQMGHEPSPVMRNPNRDPVPTYYCRECGKQDPVKLPLPYRCKG